MKEEQDAHTDLTDAVVEEDESIFEKMMQFNEESNKFDMVRKNQILNSPT